jgi:type IV pilus assembly protein PilW
MARTFPIVKPPGARGFTLVELMVALLLALLIIAGMFTAFNSASWTTNANARFSQVQNNGRYAADLLRREIQHAGYLGVQTATELFGKCPDCLETKGSIAATNYGNCGAGFVTNIALPVWGTNNSNALACTGMDYVSDSDVLVVRRAGSQRHTGVPATDSLYVRTKFNHATVFLGSDLTTSPTAPEEDYPLEADVYYISPYTTASTDSPNVPALYRLTLGAGPAITKQLLATGVENMQVQYGVSSGGITTFKNASAVTAGEWLNVVSLRIWLLARSTDIEPGYSNTKSYPIGDQTVTASDSFVRQVFPLVVGLRN